MRQVEEAGALARLKRLLRERRELTSRDIIDYLLQYNYSLGYIYYVIRAAKLKGWLREKSVGRRGMRIYESLLYEGGEGS